MVALVGAVATGCASTSNEGPAKYPELKVLSNTPYVWDDSISEALNVARMTQPAGVGVGMKDFVDGKKAITGKISGGTRIMDAGLGLITMGGFGVLSMESLNNRINKDLDWKPTLVTLIPFEEVGDKPDYKKIRNVFAAKMKDALVKEYPNIKWHGEFALAKPTINANTEFLFFDEKACKDAFLFGSTDKENQKQFYWNSMSGRTFVENTAGIEKFCAYGGMISIANVVFENGKKSYVVTFEGEWGHYFNNVFAKNFDGYVIFPDFYDFRALDKMVSIVVDNEYAHVKQKGKELLFQK